MIIKQFAEILINTGDSPHTRNVDAYMYAIRARRDCPLS
jgi:hypothetical protein